VTIPNTAPAAVAVATLIPNPIADTLSTFTPSNRADTGFCTVARTVRPNSVRDSSR